MEVRDAILAAPFQRAGAQCINDVDAKANRFLQRQVTISPGAFSLTQVIDLLTDQKIPVSFIQAVGKETTLNIPNKPGTAEDVLKAICQSVPSYEVSILYGRIVVHPKDPKLQVIAQDMNIRNLSRLEAAREVTEILKNKYQMFDDLVPPFVFGNPNNTIYTDPVTIVGSMSALKALVALLGSDESLTLQIVKAKTDVRLMGFKKVSL
jgi:hypothetical protein